jgi:hypothetical protein
MPLKKTFSSTRIAARPLGGPRNTIQDTRPAQKPPESDTSVLVHDCFDQHGGEIKSEDCACTQRTSRIDAAALIRRCRADALVIVRYGRPEKKRDSIVLRRDYVEKLRMKAKVDGQKLLPAILKHGSVLSFKKNVIRGKNGTAIELDLNRTDAEYWNTVMVQLGLGVSAGAFLKDAAFGMGLPVRITSLENFEMADAATGHSDIDPEVDAVMAVTIAEHKRGVRSNRRSVRPRGTAANSEDPNDAEPKELSDERLGQLFPK